MAILENEITITLTSKNIKHFETAGYYIPKYKDKSYRWKVKIGTKINVKVKDLSIGSNVNVKFICDYCNGDNQKDEKSKLKVYHKLINARKIINKDSCNHRNCKYAKLKEIRTSEAIEKGESLAENYHHLIEEWHEKNNKTPWEYTKKSGQKVWWRCKVNPKHEWETSIYNRSNGDGCPYCSGHKTTEENNLVALFPHLIKEIHPTKNYDLQLHTLSPYSNKIVWWICENHQCHEWKTSVNNRTSKNSNCPYCAGFKAWKENNLVIFNPELAEEWHPTLNGELTPYDVTKSSGAKVWWLGDCGHEWVAMVRDRNNGKTGCPTCSESKGEKRIRKWLEGNGVIFEPQKEYDYLLGLKGKNLSYDFYLPVQNILIEYQGEFHDGSASNQTVEEFKSQQEHDKRKKEYAEKNEIWLFEIWYLDFNNIEEILYDKVIKSN